MDSGRRIINWKVLFSSFFLFFMAFSQLAGQSSFTSIRVFEENGVKGILDSEGKEVIPAKYFDLGWTKGLPEFHQNIIGYRESERWGLVNSGNKIITPPKYTHLYPASNSSLLVAAIPGKFSGENFFGLINSSGKVIIPFMYAGIEVFGDVAIIRTLSGNKSKFGLVNMSNQPVLPFQYDNITPVNTNLLAVTKPDRKIVLVNTHGKETIRYNLDSIGEADNSFYRIYSEGKVGLMAANGTLIASPEFKKIEVSANKEKLSFLKFSEWKFLDINGNEQPGFLADEVLEIAPGIFRLTLNNQSWLMSETFNILSRPFDNIFPISNRHFKSEIDRHFGIINADGREILPVSFDSLYSKGPYIYTTRNIGNRKEWSLYDTLGIKKTHFEYQEMKPSSEGLIPVKRNNKWGFITREGNEAIHCVYDFVTPFENDKSIVSLHGEEGIINSNGDWILLPAERKIELINDSLILERTRFNNRLITIENELIYFTTNELTFKGTYLLERIDSATNWHISLMGTIINDNARPDLGPIPVFDSLFIVYRKGDAGLVSESGRELIPFGEWEEIYPPSEEFLGIKDDDFYGFIDMDNKLRIANRYEGIGPFNEGLAAIKVRGKWGFIDKREILVCQPLYEEVGEFSHNTCIVRSGDKWGLIGNDGKLIQETEFDAIDILKTGFMITMRDGSYGLLDESGKTILFPKYEWLEVLDNGMIMIRRKDRFGLLNSNGVNVLPAIYFELRYIPDKDILMSMTPGEWDTRQILTN